VPWGPNPQLASALAHVHANGVLHRDVKTANVLLLEPVRPIPAQPQPPSAEGCAAGAEPPLRVLLSDFGIAVRLAGGPGEAGGAWDAVSVAAGGKPTGGFHKRHMVRAWGEGTECIYAASGRGRGLGASFGLCWLQMGRERVESWAWGAARGFSDSGQEPFHGLAGCVAACDPTTDRPQLNMIRLI
jgi:serine/threonine protein kinase